MFIGIYSRANWITLGGLTAAVISCFLAANDCFKLAIFMLFAACVCDTIDGTIARATPNRTPSEKYYGVQIDSLCDVISFGLTPCFIAFSFGFDGILDVIVYCIFIACGAIRLAYFNTRVHFKPEKAKDFRGIPIPMSTFVLTVLFLLTAFIPASTTVWLFRVFMFVLAIGFILNVPIKKPKLNTAFLLILIEVVLIIILAFAGNLKAPVDDNGSNAETSDVSDVSDVSEEA